MITQGNKYVDKMKHIVFPFSHDKESIQIAPFVYTLAKQFKSTVHLVGFHDKNALIESKMKTHQRLLVKYFADHQTECVIAHIDKTKNFEKELISYAQQVDADLFAATFFSSSLIKGMSGFLQALIENEYSIPVLTVNAEDLVVSSVSSVMM
jgi:serine kinase of HPr protein (carbohydrate metabolism regulator)